LQSNGLLDRSVALNVALGDKSSTAFLHVHEGHSGTGTLTVGNGSVPVSVEPADAVLALPDIHLPIFVKMDVEGYEVRVLAGMPKLLERPNLAVLVEVSRDMLARVGDSVQALHETLESAGFSCHLIRHHSGRWGETLLFEPIAEALDEYQYDALYVKQGSIFEQRINKHIKGGSRSNSR
jgi:hypothetical protein